jgi:hypothetical protein
MGKVIRLTQGIHIKHVENIFALNTTPGLDALPWLILCFVEGLNVLLNGLPVDGFNGWMSAGCGGQARRTDCRLAGGRLDGRSVDWLEAKLDGRIVDWLEAKLDGKIVDLLEARLDGKIFDWLEAKLDGRIVDWLEAKLDGKIVDWLEARLDGRIVDWLEAKLDGKIFDWLEAKLDGRIPHHEGAGGESDFVDNEAFQKHIKRVSNRIRSNQKR